MRFFRVFFWVCSVYSILCGIAVISLPNLVAGLFVDHAPQAVLVQALGLFSVVMGVGYGYAAENPNKAKALVGLGVLLKIFFPVLGVLAMLRNECTSQILWFHGYNDWIWLPFFLSFFVWYYHHPRPSSFLRFMDFLNFPSRADW